VAGVGLALAGTAALVVFGWSLYGGLSGQSQLSSLPAIGLYYVLPAGAAVGLFASLRLGPVQRLRLVLACLSVGASVYISELFLTVSISRDSQLKPVMSLLAASSDKRRYAADLTARFGHDIDIRTADEVVTDLHDRGLDAIPIVTASNHLFVTQSDGSVKSAIQIDGHEVMPLGSVSHTRTILCNENGSWVDYPSDQRGFNNPDEVWQSNSLDIAAVGDSFAHGYCVPAARNFVALIRQRYPSTLNLGFAGNGPLLMLATMKEYLPHFAPKVVLWFYYEGNDLTDLQIERKSRLLINYLTGDYTQVQLARQSDIDHAIIAELPQLAAKEREVIRQRVLNSVRYQLLTFAKLTAVRERLGLVQEADRSDLDMAADFAGANLGVFREIMSQATSRVAAWGGQMYFVYLPEWARYTSYRSGGKAKRDEVLALVRALGIPIIDIDPAFQGHGDPLSLFPFRGVGHYTEDGHRVVAEEVLKQVTPGRSGD
jgi:hypothetical protein